MSPKLRIMLNRISQGPNVRFWWVWSFWLWSTSFHQLLTINSVINAVYPKCIVNNCVGLMVEYVVYRLLAIDSILLIYICMGAKIILEIIVSEIFETRKWFYYVGKWNKQVFYHRWHNVVCAETYHRKLKSKTVSSRIARSLSTDPPATYSVLCRIILGCILYNNWYIIPRVG